MGGPRAPRLIRRPNPRGAYVDVSLQKTDHAAPHRLAALAGLLLLAAAGAAGSRAAKVDAPDPWYVSAGLPSPSWLLDAANYTTLAGWVDSRTGLAATRWKSHYVVASAFSVAPAGER